MKRGMFIAILVMIFAFGVVEGPVISDAEARWDADEARGRAEIKKERDIARAKVKTARQALRTAKKLARKAKNDL